MRKPLILRRRLQYFVILGFSLLKTLTGALSAEYFGPEFEVRAVGLSWVSMPILLV